MRSGRLVAPLFVLALIAACGPSAKEKALRTSLTGLNAARDGFVAWDQHHQQTIVDEADSYEAGQARLATYRQSREKVLQAFTVAYSALAAAALDPSPEMLMEALVAVRHAYDLVKLLTGDSDR